MQLHYIYRYNVSMKEMVHYLNLNLEKCIRGKDNETIECI